MNTQFAKLDFTGQHIYIGIDVGKRSWKICILTEYMTYKTFSHPPSVEMLVRYLHHAFPGATYHCVYEAGFCGFWICERLQKSGISCIVVNPADVPTTDKECRHKNDRIDARKLARCLRNGDLVSIYVPDRSQLENRSILRMRGSVVKKQTRCKNQIKSLLDFYGIAIPEHMRNSYWSRRFIQWLESITFENQQGTMALKILLDELHHHRHTLLTLTKEIRTLANTPPFKDRTGYLISISGISVLTAMILMTELVSIDRFPFIDNLQSFCGLIPGEHSTGDTEIITGITSRRNTYLRHLLIECSWVAVRYDLSLLNAFNVLSHRMPKNQAIIRIARKLLRRIHFVLKHQQPYQQITVQVAA